MELIIETLTGDSFALKVNESETILSIKNRIHKQGGIPVTNQFLVWRDQELSDFRSLTDYEITSGSKLKLILKLVGGPVNNSYGLSKLSSFEFINRKLESILSSHSSRSFFDDSEEEEEEESILESEEDATVMSSSAKNLKDILRQIRKKQENKITLLIIQYENDIKLLTLPLSTSSSSSDDKIERLSELEKNETKSKSYIPKILADIPKTHNFKPSKSSILYSEASSDDYESETWSSSFTNNSSSSHTATVAHPRSQSSSNIWNNSVTRTNNNKLKKNKNLYYSSESFLRFDLKKKTCLTPDCDLDFKEWIKTISKDIDSLKVGSQGSDISNNQGNEPVIENTPLVAESLIPNSSDLSLLHDENSIPEKVEQLCSKDFIIQSLSIIKPSNSTQDLSSISPSTSNHPTNKNRCAFCRRKMGLIGGFLCSCGNTYCTLHRYAEMHDCQFDYKTEGRRIISHANPQILSSKLPKI